MLDFGRLITRNAQGVAFTPQACKAGRNIGVEIGATETIPGAHCPTRLALAFEIEAGTNDLERTPVMLIPFDDAAKYSEERKVGNLEPVCPGGPLACLVDQRLTHVKKYLPYAHNAPVN
jgi:hypothetical protein